MPSPFRVAPVRPGPALRRRRVPLLAITVSTIGHGLTAGALLVWVIWGVGSSQKVYVVNLVPAVAAVGSPSGAPAPALPPRPATLAPSRSSSPEPEPREARAREAVTLPDSPAVTPRLPS